ncbi:DUF4422 domain-containing protein [Microbacterium sp.]|uniref:DUF4422 domain-containing protein n=1 Tax=Microbacterium sp. TaxID=51671 RepID=UPI003A94CC6A
MSALMLVATHKLAPMPADALYLPVHVGHARSDLDLGYQPDDSGENISMLNPSFCELTALYWAWKNLPDADLGLSHYRRYFAGHAHGPRGSKILGGDEAADLLASHDLVLGHPRNYLIETVENHYRNGHHGSDLEVLRRVVGDHSPEMLDAYDGVFAGTSLSLYNMFLGRRDVVDAYASWVFPILNDVSSQIDNDSRTVYQQRTFGYLGERLLNVWARSQVDQLSVTYRRIVNTEGEPKLKKAVGFLKRKLRGGPVQ